MLKHIHTLGLLLSLLAVSACSMFTMPEKEITALTDIPADYVLVVGKVSLDPPLKDTEKNLNVPNDLFGSEEMMSNRAILGFNEKPSVTLEKSGFLINPELDNTFFFAVPKNRINMVGGYITVSYSMSVQGPYNSTINHGKVLVPPLQLDIKSSDRIIYIGTLHLERGPFNEVVSANIIDDYNSAKRDLNKRFGTTQTMRKALSIN